MRFIVFLILVLVFTSCKKSKLADIIDKTTEMEIHYTNYFGEEVGMYKTNFSGEINMLNKYFNGVEITAGEQCYPEGFIILKNRTDSFHVELGLDNNCQRIVFTLDGEKHAEDITLEGVTFFKRNRFEICPVGSF